MHRIKIRLALARDRPDVLFLVYRRACCLVPSAFGQRRALLLASNLYGDPSLGTH
jgi:hypothetical protein